MARAGRGKAGGLNCTIRVSLSGSLGGSGREIGGLHSSVVCTLWLMSALSSLPFISALPPLLYSSITATSFFSSVAWCAVSLATPLRTPRSSGGWCSPVSAVVPSCFPLHASPSALGLSGNCSDFSFSIMLEWKSKKALFPKAYSGIQW